MAIERIDSNQRMSKCVVHGNTVYLAGMVASDPKGKDMAAQTKDILSQIWVTSMSKFAAMNAVWDAWVSPGNTPARATVEAKLAAPEYKVEIMVQAAK